MLTTVKRLTEIGFLLGILCLVGCTWTGEGNGSAVSHDEGGTFGAFNDETYVWENYQFTTNRVKETK